MVSKSPHANATQKKHYSSLHRFWPKALIANTSMVKDNSYHITGFSSVYLHDHPGHADIVDWEVWPRGAHDMVLTREGPAVDIKDARGLVNQGKTVKIQGRITVEPSTMVDWATTNSDKKQYWETGFGFAIQGDQAGIWVFVEADDDVWYKSNERALMKLGTLVEVSGTIDSSSGVIRIVPTGAKDISIVPGSTVEVVEPVIISAESIPHTQGLLVKIPNLYYDHYLKNTKYGEEVHGEDAWNKGIGVW